jgi:carbon monoxide dehydrogenase subunit G
VTVLRIDERFVVGAPVERVWDHLVDPRRVVACVPGGELRGLVDARTFEGRVRMRIGPFPLSYTGRVRLADADPSTRHATLVGEAREGAGGSARLVLDSTVSPDAAGGAEVVAHARLDVSGPVAALGRGLLEEIGHVVFRDFSARVRASLEAPEGAAAPRHDALRPVPILLRALRAWMAGWLQRR